MHKDFLDKLVEHGNGQLVEVLIFVNQSDKTVSVLFVLLIALDSLFQSRDFGGKLGLFLFVLSVRVVQEAQSSQQTAEVKKQRIRLATAKQRVSELEVLLCKIYEDNILGKLSDSRYATLDAQYEKEQTELTAEISVLEKAIKSYEKHEKDADRFIALIDKYENFDKLTIAMLNEFIEKILVHERDRKGSIQTTQEVEIYFNFVGRFVPPAFGEVELTPEELEEIRKREERKDRLHQNYLKRKANGKQKEYEERTKAKKKAEIEARKQAIRTEDIARGVFIPVSSLPQLGPRKGA